MSVGLSVDAASFSDKTTAAAWEPANDLVKVELNKNANCSTVASSRLAIPEIWIVGSPRNSRLNLSAISPSV